MNSICNITRPHGRIKKLQRMQDAALPVREKRLVRQRIFLLRRSLSNENILE